MIVSKPTIICHVSQAFFGFLAMCCFASVAAFQAHWHIGPCVYSLLAHQDALLTARRAIVSWVVRIRRLCIHRRDVPGPLFTLCPSSE